MKQDLLILQSEILHISCQRDNLTHRSMHWDTGFFSLSKRIILYPESFLWVTEDLRLVWKKHSYRLEKEIRLKMTVAKLLYKNQVWVMFSMKEMGNLKLKESNRQSASFLTSGQARRGTERLFCSVCVQAVATVSTVAWLYLHLSGTERNNRHLSTKPKQLKCKELHWWQIWSSDVSAVQNAWQKRFVWSKVSPNSPKGHIRNLRSWLTRAAEKAKTNQTYFCYTKVCCNRPFPNLSFFFLVNLH